MSGRENVFLPGPATEREPQEDDQGQENDGEEERGMSTIVDEQQDEQSAEHSLRQRIRHLCHTTPHNLFQMPALRLAEHRLVALRNLSSQQEEQGEDDDDDLSSRSSVCRSAGFDADLPEWQTWSGEDIPLLYPERRVPSWMQDKTTARIMLRPMFTNTGHVFNEDTLRVLKVDPQNGQPITSAVPDERLQQAIEDNLRRLTGFESSDFQTTAAAASTTGEPDKESPSPSSSSSSPLKRQRLSLGSKSSKQPSGSTSTSNRPSSRTGSGSIRTRASNYSDSDDSRPTTEDEDDEGTWSPSSLSPSARRRSHTLSPVSLATVAEQLRRERNAGASGSLSVAAAGAIGGGGRGDQGRRARPSMQQFIEDEQQQPHEAEGKGVLSSSEYPPPIDNLVTVKEIGRGGFARAVLARNTDTGQLVVVKIIPKAGELSRAEVENERDVLRSIHSACNPFLLCLDTYAEDSTNYYIVTDYLDDHTNLWQAVDTRWSEAAVPTEEEAAAATPTDEDPNQRIADIAKNTLSGVLALHARGIAHRDIKPENILVRLRAARAATNGNRYQPRFIDFGLACERLRCNTARAGAGTPGYMAPELFGPSFRSDTAGKKKNLYALQKTDLWALGTTLFWLLTNGTREYLNAFTGVDPHDPQEDKKTREILADIAGHTPDWELRYPALFGDALRKSVTPARLESPALAPVFYLLYQLLHFDPAARTTEWDPTVAFRLQEESPSSVQGTAARLPLVVPVFTRPSAV